MPADRSVPTRKSQWIPLRIHAAQATEVAAAEVETGLGREMVLVLNLGREMVLVLSLEREMVPVLGLGTEMVLGKGKNPDQTDP